MSVKDIIIWERSKELAKIANIKIELKKDIFLTDKNGKNLGAFETSEQVYFFLCGYEHFSSTNK